MKQFVGKEIEVYIASCITLGEKGGVEMFKVTGDVEEDGQPVRIEFLAFRDLADEKKFSGLFEETPGKALLPYRLTTAEDRSMLEQAKAAVKAKEEKAKQKAKEEEAARQAKANETKTEQDQRHGKAQVADVLMDQKYFTAVEIEVMRASGIIPDGTPDLIILGFFDRCKTIGLDPRNKEIYLLKSRTWNQELNNGKGAYEAKFHVVIGIDGARKKVLATGKYRGLSEVLYDGMTQKEWAANAKKEYMAAVASNALPDNASYADKKKAAALINQSFMPFMFSCSITREIEGHNVEIPVTLFTHEFLSATNPQHSQMPMHMLAKILQMHAYRAAFADVFGGPIHIEEEFQREGFEDRKGIRAATTEQAPVLELQAATRLVDSAQSLEELNDAIKKVGHQSEDFYTNVVDVKVKELKEIQATA